MTIYLIEARTSDKAFVNKQLAEEYLEEINHKRLFRSYIKPIELVTDTFMEQILQPHKPKSKFNKESL